MRRAACSESVPALRSVAEVMDARAKSRPQQAETTVSRRRAGVSARAVAYGATALYALVFACAAAAWHLAYQTARFDLGNMTQAVWSAAHGHLLEVTTLGGRQTVRLGVHADSFLALLAPLWRIWPSPVMLLVLQALAVSSGALPVFWLARKHLPSERAAAQFALAYLVFPATQWNAFTASGGFHAVSFAMPLMLYAIWFLDEDRLLPFAVVGLLAATTKEQMPLVVGCLGIWYGLSKRRPLVGGGLFLLGLTLTALNFFVVIPHFTPAGLHPFRDRYATVGGSPGGVLHTLLTNPGAVASDVASWHKLVYLVLLLVPFLGVWALSPALLIAAVPDLALNLLSTKPGQTTITFQYTASIVPCVLVASIFGAAKLKRHAERSSLYILAGTLSIAVISPFLFGPGHLREALPGNPVHRAKADALALVPSGVPVSASNHLGAQLSTRKRILMFPFVREARWVVVDANDETIADRKGYLGAIDTLGRDPHWRRLYSVRGVMVFHRLS
jgi:uncharacterized membrane protein